jgi:hypothetical protein
MVRRALGTGSCLMLLAAPAAALDVQVKDITAPASSVRAAIELRDVVPERFKRVLDDNGVLFLRLQAELWDSRPVWDRLIYPATVRVERVTHGSLPPNPMAASLELGDVGRIVSSGRYYVHVIATLGTLAERDVDQMGDAVFGRESEANGLGSLGRLFFRTALQIGDYLQSVSTETTSRKINGRELLKPKP